MNEIKKKVDLIIEKVFVKEYFYDTGSQSTINKVNDGILLFEQTNPEFINSFYRRLCESFPNGKVENWTQFFLQDRCVRFLVQINEELRFIAQVSIFDFFSVYRHPMTVVNGKNEFGEIKFINHHESKISDLIYACTSEYNGQLIWLEKNTLNQIISEFSTHIPEVETSFEFTIADALFSSHYL